MYKNKSTLIIGDVHCKTDTILPVVDAAISKYKVEKVVFVGDYFDEWNVTNETIYEAIDALIEWKNSKTDEGIEVVLLVGNHDYAYLDRMSCCSGHHFDAEPFAFRRITEHMDMRVADVVGNLYLVTHAGVSSLFHEKFLKGTSTPEEIATNLNDKFNIVIDIAKELNDKGLDMFSGGELSPLSPISLCGGERGGSAEFSGPLWCGYRELNKYKLPGISQIVGHTPTKTVISTLWNDDNGAYAIYWCDTFTVAPDMKPMGDSSFLLWDTDKLHIVYPYYNTEHKLLLNDVPANE